MRKNFVDIQPSQHPAPSRIKRIVSAVATVATLAAGSGAALQARTDQPQVRAETLAATPDPVAAAEAAISAQAAADVPARRIGRVPSAVMQDHLNRTAGALIDGGLLCSAEIVEQNGVAIGAYSAAHCTAYMGRTATQLFTSVQVYTGANRNNLQLVGTPTEAMLPPYTSTNSDTLIFSFAGHSPAEVYAAEAAQTNRNPLQPGDFAAASAWPVAQPEQRQDLSLTYLGSMDTAIGRPVGTSAKPGQVHTESLADDFMTPQFAGAARDPLYVHAQVFGMHRNGDEAVCSPGSSGTVFGVEQQPGQIADAGTLMGYIALSKAVNPQLSDDQITQLHSYYGAALGQPELVGSFDALCFTLPIEADPSTVGFETLQVVAPPNVPGQVG